jgi:hypothetical protein
MFELIGLSAGLLAFGILGTILLLIDPTTRFSLSNLAVFVVGAFPGAIFTGLAWVEMFGDDHPILASSGAGPMTFACAAALSGRVLVLAKERVWPTKNTTGQDERQLGLNRNL